MSPPLLQRKSWTMFQLTTAPSSSANNCFLPTTAEIWGMHLSSRSLQQFWGDCESNPSRRLYCMFKLVNMFLDPKPALNLHPWPVWEVFIMLFFSVLTLLPDPRSRRQLINSLFLNNTLGLWHKIAKRVYACNLTKCGKGPRGINTSAEQRTGL